MRLLNIFCTLVMLSSFAAAQATVIGGYASNWPPNYGVYATPFVPLVTTPSVSLDSYSPLPAGASNATQGLVAGASNSTFDNVVSGPGAAFAVTHWYGPAVEGPGAAAIEKQPEPEHSRVYRDQPFETGVAFFQSSEGVATLAGLSKPAAKASRTVTNDDIDRMNQNTGTVKYESKTEKLQ